MTYTVAQVAAELGIDATRVRRLALSRHVGRKHGPMWVFDDSDIDAMRSRKAGRPRKPAEP